MRIRRAAKDAHKIFRKRGWTYWDYPTVPPVEALERAIRTVVDAVHEPNVDESATGHFLAIKDECGWVKVCLILDEGEL